MVQAYIASCRHALCNCYTGPMKPADHKAIRRKLLEFLYASYLDDPLLMVEPEPLLALPGVDSKNIIPNMHYLYDRKLVEMMMGYTPPMFSAVRITAAGIDMVEDHYNFDLQFPPRCSPDGDEVSTIPQVVEHLVAQGDLSPLEGWVRHQLLQDIQYLRHELAQPREQWRMEVIYALLEWIGRRDDDAGGALPALHELRRLILDAGARTP